MLVFPKAKINLGLHITGKRPDGYHNIETIFYPVNLFDALEMVADENRTGKDTLTLTGYELQGNPDDNIVLKAVRILRQRYRFPKLRIHLHKAIPAGAGLGGGSSDAAFALKAINRAFNLSAGIDELKEIAGEVGSDSPFFIECQPAFATGRGEILKPADHVLDGFHAVLLNPGIMVSTKEAYENCEPSAPEISLNEIIEKPPVTWKELLRNDFEKSVFWKFPEIEKIKNTLYETGAIYSSMSGSGSTVYGIFRAEPEIPVEIRKYVIFSGVL